MAELDSNPVFVPPHPLRGGRERHWITLPSHAGPLGNPESEASGQPGIFGLEDKIMDESEQPKVTLQVWQSSAKENPWCCDEHRALPLGATEGSNPMPWCGGGSPVRRVT